MAKTRNKTQQTVVSPLEFLGNIEHNQKREDGFALLEFFRTVSEMEPKMWGASIIGFGRYYYKYESGREGEHLITGFSPRKSAISIYIMPGYRDLSAQLNKLGKHKIGKSCLYINKLSDIDMHVLEEIVRNGISYMKANYKTWEV